MGRDPILGLETFHFFDSLIRQTKCNYLLFYVQVSKNFEQKTCYCEKQP